MVRSAVSRSARDFSTRASASFTRFWIAPPAYSGRLNCRPTLAVLLRTLPAVGKLELGPRATWYCPTRSSVGLWPAWAFCASISAISKALSVCRTTGCWRRASCTQASGSAGSTVGRVTGAASARGMAPLRPTSWSRASFLTSRSLLAAISWATTRSKRAWASRESVTVEVPTSKLRLAEASCSDTADFCACTKVRVSWAAATSKYACAVRTIRSCSAASSWALAMSIDSWPCSLLKRLTGRYRGWLAERATFCELLVLLVSVTLLLLLAQLAPAPRPAWGRSPALACSALASAASCWARADCSVESKPRAAS